MKKKRKKNDGYIKGSKGKMNNTTDLLVITTSVVSTEHYVHFSVEEEKIGGLGGKYHSRK